MSAILRPLSFGLLALLSASAVAGPAATANRMRPQFIGLRVGVDAAGKVQSSQPLDTAALPAFNQAAAEVARKLVFTPARKNGVPVASETSLSMTLALEPRADGQYLLQLKRAQNGPSVAAMGKPIPNRYAYSGDNGAYVVVGANLRPDGTVDLDSLKTERMELRSPSKFAEARYLETITSTLRSTRFLLDKVEGADTPSRISVPFRFGGGPAKRTREQEQSGKPPAEDLSLSFLTAVSSVPEVELPKIDYTAPASTAPSK